MRVDCVLIRERMNLFVDGMSTETWIETFKKETVDIAKMDVNALTYVESASRMRQLLKTGRSFSDSETSFLLVELHFILAEKYLKKSFHKRYYNEQHTQL